MAEEQTPVPSRAMIGRWNVDQYIDLLRWPVLIGGLILLVAGLTWQGSLMTILLQLALLGWMSWTLQQHRAGRTESLAAGAGLGLALGFAHGLGQFIADPSAATIAGLVSTTVLTAVIASLVTTSLTLLLSLIPKKHT